jgi:hypothetical protein
MCSATAFIHHALPGWDATAERRDAEDEFHSAAQAPGKGVGGRRLRCAPRPWPLAPTEWAARPIGAGRAAPAEWRRRLWGPQKSLCSSTPPSLRTTRVGRCGGEARRARRVPQRSPGKGVGGRRLRCGPPPCFLSTEWAARPIRAGRAAPAEGGGGCARALAVYTPPPPNSLDVPHAAARQHWGGAAVWRAQTQVLLGRLK